MNGTFDWANLIAIVTFVLGYFIRWGLDVLDRRIMRKNFYKVLAAEIRLNVVALDKAVSSLPPIVDIRAFLRAGPTNRLHMVSTYKSVIYETNTSLLTQLPVKVARNIIEFYGTLEFIDELVAAFERKSFETIAQTGREAPVDKMIEALKRALQLGTDLSDLISRELGIP